MKRFSQQSSMSESYSAGISIWTMETPKCVNSFLKLTNMTTKRRKSLLKYFKHYPGVFIVDLEQVNVSWVTILRLKLTVSYKKLHYISLNIIKPKYINYINI